MTSRDTLIPVHLPYRQMIRLLPPRRPVGVPCPPSCEGGMCGCDEDDDDDDEPRHDAPECRRFHCGC